MTSGKRSRFEFENDNYEFKEYVENRINNREDLDYFEFADKLNDTERFTNMHFSNIIEILMNHKQKKYYNLGVEINKLFKQRNNNATLFGKNYHKYWNEKNNTVNNEIEARQILMLERIERISTGLVQRCEQNTSKMTKLPSSSSFSKLDIVDLDDDEALKDHLLKDEITSLSSLLQTKKYKASEPCSCFISKLLNCSNSPTQLLNIARSNVLDELDVPFDLYLHWDLVFAEDIVKHFLYLMVSNNNPLKRKCLERTTAILTTITILNKLFLINNDLLEFKWIETTIKATEETKWDGIAFCVEDNKLTPFLVEFSGGVKTNTNNAKEKNDIQKVYSRIRKVSDAVNAYEEYDKNFPLFIVRFSDNKLYFESFIDFKHVNFKKTNFVMKCPVTTQELKGFVQKIPELFNWKQSVVVTAERLNAKP